MNSHENLIECHSPGGVTYGEIAALRRLAQLEEGRRRRFQRSHGHMGPGDEELVTQFLWIARDFPWDSMRLYGI